MLSGEIKKARNRLQTVIYYNKINLQRKNLVFSLFHDRIGTMNRPIPDQVILGLLKFKPAHGYELLDYFRSRSHLGWIWTMSTSQLYAVLKRLEQSCAIIGQEIDVLGAPSRVEYTITIDGEEQLNGWLFDQHPSASVHRIRVMFLSRVYIANLLCYPVDAILQSQITACQAQRYKFIQGQNQSQTEIERLTIDFIVQQLDSAISWLTDTTFIFAKPFVNNGSS